MSDRSNQVGAVILGAGQSRRMGKPKLTLPWGNTTVIQSIVETIHHEGITSIVLVTGGAVDEVAACLRDTAVLLVHNSDYQGSEMLESCQIGLTVLPDTLTACLIVLGDQPQMRGENVRKILETYPITVDTLVLPSYSMRRGHPWLVGRKYWGDVMALRTPQSLRDFLRTHSDAIRYVMVDDDSILNDIDTPEDYASQRPMSPGK